MVLERLAEAAVALLEWSGLVSQPSDRRDMTYSTQLHLFSGWANRNYSRSSCEFCSHLNGQPGESRVPYLKCLACKFSGQQPGT